MSPRQVALLIVVVAGVGVYAAPRTMLSPGELVAGHRDLEDRCSACHLALRGTPAGKCIECHEIADIDSQREGPPLHAGLARRDCGLCHTDHRGSEPGRATVAFVHSSLGSELAQNCAECHVRPSDSLHSGQSERCADCHVVESWSPASIDHTRYFRFDRHHPAVCESCHLTGEFSRYTCYECHEHSPRSVAREHREEGIREFDACADCHRSGDEHEAKRNWRARGRAGSENADAGIGREEGSDSDSDSDRDRW